MVPPARRIDAGLMSSATPPALRRRCCSIPTTTATAASAVSNQPFRPKLRPQKNITDRRPFNVAMPSASDTLPRLWGRPSISPCSAIGFGQFRDDPRRYRSSVVYPDSDDAIAHAPPIVPAPSPGTSGDSAKPRCSCNDSSSTIPPITSAKYRASRHPFHWFPHDLAAAASTTVSTDIPASTQPATNVLPP